MSDYSVVCFFIFIIGASIGSFLNVVALRALSKESIVMPASKCPKCNTPIKWYDNIPILSYFLTIKGKCRACGEKVSIQYPVVELVTAVIFLGIFLAYGISLKAFLLLILLCTSIVITITDIRKETVFDVHSWILIITSLLLSVYLNGMRFAFTGLVLGAVIMEATAYLSYFLIRKKSVEDNDTNNKTDENNNVSEENMDIDTYVNKNKRAFGEGDTYLAAASGALLGVKYFIAAVFCAIIFQAICILPKFIKNLYNQKQIRLLVSLSCFVVFSLIYFILSNLFDLNIFVVLSLIVILIFFAFDTITGLKKSAGNSGFIAIPFGPALLLSTFVMFFFGKYVLSFIKTYILLITG